MGHDEQRVGTFRAKTIDCTNLKNDLVQPITFLSSFIVPQILSGQAGTRGRMLMSGAKLLIDNGSTWDILN